MNDGHDDHDDFGGLDRDLPRLFGRRRALILLGGVGVATLVGCGSDADSTAAGSTTTTTAAGGSTGSTTTTAAGATTGAAAECTTIPEETAGPYPGDGTNGPNVLTESGIVRSDITSSFGSSSTKALGVPVTVNLVIQKQSAGCTNLADAAVYLWHCNRDGLYSLYSQGITGENYLRGVQQTDANGRVTFKSIFPAAYSGRWPHIHFEVFPSLAEATKAGTKLRTSQIALPEETAKLVYATSGYEASVRNLSQTTLARDNVFGDDSGAHQIPTIAGSVADGFTIELTVPV
jgi:protocatechuate 3,4-dioxygenase beta subunit